ncbi:rhombosortase [Vibrio sp. VB16]|uniref:rhombosortase n=1 Tax=Vibrio sp. VB16 TaxID=2785746 RepID=UPI00189F3745|nr:rhombosortase [Vibrio sp. VB16]UGA55628.1 rhombosortase [Vibrio sp. VB16]
MKLSYFLILVTVISALFQLPYLQNLVVWHHELIQNGQWWRILSGNFTHTNTIHFSMNIAAMWVIAYLFKPSAKSLLGALLFLSTSVGLGLLFSTLHSYAGLSGVLHGLFAFYALSEALYGRKSSWLLVIGLIIKIVHEQLYGASISTAKLISAEVAIEAHLIGGVTGLSLAVMLYVLLRFNTHSTT